MKRIFLLILSLGLLGSISGCGTPKEESSTPLTSTTNNKVSNLFSVVEEKSNYEHYYNDKQLGLYGVIGQNIDAISEGNFFDKNLNKVLNVDLNKISTELNLDASYLTVIGVLDNVLVIANSDNEDRTQVTFKYHEIVDDPVLVVNSNHVHGFDIIDNSLYITAAYSKKLEDYNNLDGTASNLYKVNLTGEVLNDYGEVFSMPPRGYLPPEYEVVSIAGKMYYTQGSQIFSISGDKLVEESFNFVDNGIVISNFIVDNNKIYAVRRDGHLYVWDKDWNIIENVSLSGSSLPEKYQKADYTEDIKIHLVGDKLEIIDWFYFEFTLEHGVAISTNSYNIKTKEVVEKLNNEIDLTLGYGKLYI